MVISTHPPKGIGDWKPPLVASRGYRSSAHTRRKALETPLSPIQTNHFSRHQHTPAERHWRPPASRVAAGAMGGHQHTPAERHWRPHRETPHRETPRVISTHPPKGIGDSHGGVGDRMLQDVISTHPPKGIGDPPLSPIQTNHFSSSAHTRRKALETAEIRGGQPRDPGHQHTPAERHWRLATLVITPLVFGMSSAHTRRKALETPPCDRWLARHPSHQHTPAERHWRPMPSPCRYQGAVPVISTHPPKGIGDCSPRSWRIAQRAVISTHPPKGIGDEGVDVTDMRDVVSSAHTRRKALETTPFTPLEDPIDESSAHTRRKALETVERDGVAELEELKSSAHTRRKALETSDVVHCTRKQEVISTHPPKGIGDWRIQLTTALTVVVISTHPPKGIGDYLPAWGG